MQGMADRELRAALHRVQRGQSLEQAGPVFALRELVHGEPR